MFDWAWPPASRCWEVTIVSRNINICGVEQHGIRVSLHPKALLSEYVCRRCLYALSGCLEKPSNPALRPSLELLRPAPLRCGEGKGHSKRCCRKRLHTRKKWLLNKWSIKYLCMRANVQMNVVYQSIWERKQRKEYFLQISLIGILSVFLYTLPNSLHNDVSWTDA